LWALPYASNPSQVPAPPARGFFLAVVAELVAAIVPGPPTGTTRTRPNCFIHANEPRLRQGRIVGGVLRRGDRSVVRRSGRVVTKDLHVGFLPVGEDARAPSAA